jgi:hypothetical protein
MSAKSDKGNKDKGHSGQADPIQAAIEYGIDVSMLVDNLHRSVTERIRRHQVALNMTKKLRKAKRL